VGIASALAEVVAAFRGVSVSVDNGAPFYLRATSDPQDIQTPTAWIPLPETEFQFQKKRLSCNWTVYLVAPNSPKQRTTTEHLSAMIDAVAGLFPFKTGELYSLTLAGGVVAQSYKLTWNSTTAIGD
jgi:hypothetical protein